MNNLAFSSPDLSSFCQLNNLGLTATGQHLCAERAVIECRFTKAPEPCPKCGTLGVSRGTLHLAIGTKLDMPHRKLNAYFKATRDLPLSCRASKKALP